MTRMDTDKGSGLGAGVNQITEKVIGCAFAVGKVLGPGFLEKVYENALVHELRKAGLRVEQQKRITIWYDGVIVGDYIADVLVEDGVLVEVKAKKAIIDDHVSQSLNYLAATNLPVCLLLNFAKRVEIKRIAGPNAPRLDVSHPCPSVPSVAAFHKAPVITHPDDFEEV